MIASAKDTTASAGAARIPKADPKPGASYATGQAALDRLGTTLPAVAKAHGMSATKLSAELTSDPTLALDKQGNLAYFDIAAPGEPAAAPAAPEASGPAQASGPQFQLASLPGADKTIYLDFDGNVTEGTTWNTAYNVPSITSPAYDNDGDPSTFSAGELTIIADAWKVIAEDFAPWNVNVTTIDPGVEALRNSGAGDTKWGVRVVFTKDTFAGCGCGGHAYVGSFDDATDIPAFVYNRSFRGASEAGTHEAGHTLNLSHDGLTSGTTYYGGHGSGETSWAPIMGVGYFVNTVQWSQQEFTGANNGTSTGNYGNGADDIAILGSMTNGNNFGLRADDHGDTAATATAISGTDVLETGTVGTRADVDAFSFTTQGGLVSLDAQPLAAPFGNLDVALTLRNSSGAQVAVADNPDARAAGLVATVPAGTYTVSLDGVGAGDPIAATPTGYTDYASIGQYSLRVQLQTGPPPPDTTPPAAPTGLAASVNGSSVDLSWSANGESDLAGYRVQRAASTAGPFATVSTVAAAGTSWTDASPISGVNVYRLVAFDTSDNASVPSATASVDMTPPPAPFTVANGERSVQGTVSGTYQATQARDGVSESITEVDKGRKRSRYDTLEHRWTLPASTGAQRLSIVATGVDAGDADAGFRFEWSRDGVSWLPLATFSGTVDMSFPLGSPTGTVNVRVVDTNSTAGQVRHDTVRVDLIRIDGDVVDAPAEAMVADFTVGTQRADRRSAYGTVSVAVHDDFGTPVVGARIAVTFTGAFKDVVTIVTNADGVASYQTSTAARKPSFGVCLMGLDAGSLDYLGGKVCLPS
ncbi:MAG: hypothetical protein ACK5MP_08880 [Nostocoides sp.]